MTGAWKGEYEAVAEVLKQHGATHVQLTGFEHRPQDPPDFDAVVNDFLGR